MSDQYMPSEQQSLDELSSASWHTANALERIADAAESILEELRIARLARTPPENLTDEEREALKVFTPKGGADE